jgi:hypothetical protein
MANSNTVNWFSAKEIYNETGFVYLLWFLIFGF